MFPISVQNEPQYGFELEPVVRIRDVYPGTEFFHPGSRVQTATDSGSGSATKSLCIFNPKKCY